MLLGIFDFSHLSLSFVTITSIRIFNHNNLNLMNKLCTALVCLLLGVASSVAATPEAIYLVGDFNSWTAPEFDPNPVEMSKVGDGVFTFTLASGVDADRVAIFSAKTGWDDTANIWGTVNDEMFAQVIYKGIPISWKLCRRNSDAVDFIILNSADVTGPVTLTVDWNAGTLTAISEYAPALAEEYYFEVNGVADNKYKLTRKSDETPTLYTGTWEVPAGELNGIVSSAQGPQFGTWSSSMYLWKSYPVQARPVEIEKCNNNPFSIGNWHGGTLTGTLDMARQTLVLSSDTQPELPSKLYVVSNPSADGQWKPADCPQYLELKLDEENNPMGYFGTVTIPADGFNFKFGAEGLTGLIGTDSDAPEIYNHIVSYYYLSGSADAATLQCSNWAGGELGLEVDYAMTCAKTTQAPQQPVKLSYVYLIGLPQGMDIRDGSMPLTSTDGGLHYYGNYEIAAGEALFRFYSSLNDWDTGSIGCHISDYPAEYELTDGRFVGTVVPGGKGSWSFPSWPGGMMYIHLNLQNYTLELSNREIGGTELVKAEGNVVKAVKGGICVESADTALGVFDIFGRCVATLRAGETVSLPAGVYICGGKKLLVR